ncbi:hypothetical protein OK016_24135 [Vibrio chagasii]|nr:hypothetical protein [Vibrio chagasii]
MDKPATMSHMGGKTTINTMAFDLEMQYQDNGNKQDGKARYSDAFVWCLPRSSVTDKLHRPVLHLVLLVALA